LDKVPLGGANQHHLYSEKTGHELIPVGRGDLKAESINNLDIGDDAHDTSPQSNTAIHMVSHNGYWQQDKKLWYNQTDLTKGEIL